MNQKNIVILLRNGELEAWGSLKQICTEHKDHDFNYGYLKALKYPFDYKGFRFERVPFRERTIK